PSTCFAVASVSPAASRANPSFTSGGRIFSARTYRSRATSSTCLGSTFTSAPSVDGEAAIVDHLAPARAFLANQCREFGRGIPHRSHALLRELSAEFLGAEDLRAVAMDALDHLARRSGRRHQPEPSRVLETGQHLGGRGNVWKLRDAFAARHGERAQLSLLDEADGGAEVGGRELDLAADEVGDDGSFALVRNVRHLG